MIPGAGIPIRGLDALEQDSPDEVLILTWNLAAEVVGSVGPMVGTGTRFLVAVPAAHWRRRGRTWLSGGARPGSGGVR